MKQKHRIGVRGFVAILAFTVFGAAACGDDGATTTPSDGPTTTVGSGSTVPTDTDPVAGGSITILQESEIAGLDPNALNGSAGAGGPVLAAIFGGLVTYVASEAAVEPWLAESLTANDDFTVWTLKLRDGMVFSDQTPFDAAAVKANWDRASIAENKSPAFTFFSGLTSEVVDPTTLELTLKVPDAHFDKNLSRKGSNYIAAPASFAPGADPTSDAIGAGPFIVDTWRRDDEMVLKRNPDYFDAPRPYLDEVTFKVVTNKDQRSDTFTTGSADAFYTNIQGNAEAAVDKVEGAVYYKVDTPDATILMGNERKAPFDDVRVRRMLGFAIDRDAATEIASPGSTPAHNFTVEDSVWYTPDGALPEYDPEEAQRLIDEYVAEKGPLNIEYIASEGQATLAKFVQTSLLQLDNITVDLQVVDAVTFITAIRGLDYEFSGWGLPWTDPDVSLATFFQSEAAGNYPGYANDVVDEVVLDTGRTQDNDERSAEYQKFFEQIAQDLPVLPVWHGAYGYVFTPDIKGISVYEDGVPRLDGAWKTA